MSRIVKKPEERRREILNAAREMFRTLDYDHSTMNHLMDKLGVAKGTIWVVRRIYHRRNEIKVRRGSVLHLSDRKVVVIGSRHTEEIS